MEHTADLGGSQLGSVSSFGIDAERELYLVAYTRGSILKIIGSGSTPAVPTGLRIIR
jgi:hypothetical protein